MKNLILSFTLLSALILNPASALAEIHAIQHMNEILPYLSPGTLVVFDIDNTILEPRQTLGSDQWFEYLVKKTGSVPIALETWEKVQLKTDVQAVEASTPSLIGSIQRAGYQVMALTARPASLESRSRVQLGSVGIRLSEIVAVGPETSKGQALVDYLQRIGLKPARVVFVDDKVKHVQTVEQALDHLGIENYEFRYGSADVQVASFDTVIAEIEQRYFELSGVLLPDLQARRLINLNTAE